MAYYIQDYGKGYIAREGDKYQYVVGEKVVGTYDSVPALVEENKVSDGKETQSGQRSVADSDSADVVSTESAPKGTAKKTTRRTAKK